jgi:hypothetical protein
MHIGFGTPAVWGAGGRGSNAPDWLRQAYNSPAQTGTAASPALAAIEQVAPQQVASLDPSIGLPQEAPTPYAPDQNAVAAALTNPQPAAPALGAPRTVADMPVAAPQQSGAPQGAGSPGEIRRGADGQTYQYAETTGMAGATGPSGWIRVNADAAGQQTAQAAPQDVSSLSPMAGGTAGTAPAGAPSGGFNPGMQAAIAKALSSPYASPGEKQIATLLLNQQMEQQSQANDPVRALQIQKLQQEVNAKPERKTVVVNGRLVDAQTGQEIASYPDQVKPTGNMQDYDAYAADEKAAGRQPLGRLEYEQAVRKSGASNINLNPGSDMFAGMPKDVRDEMFKRQASAQDAGDLINVTGQGLKLLDAGAITGAGSGAKIAAIKWAQALGVDVPADAVNNTEAYRSIMAKAVGKVIKQFGSGTGLSDADRQYAERLAGGDTTLNEPAIRRILAAGVKQAQGEIDRFTTTRDKVMKGDLGALLDVQVPEVPQNIVTPPPASGGTLQNGLKWSIEP